MKKLVVICVLFCLIAPQAFTCTDFQIKAKDDSVVIGRSMEFPADLKSNVVVVPRGIQNSKYAFIAIDALEIKNCYVDGFNEKGLSFDGLMFTGAEYQAPIPGKVVYLNNLTSWVLGNFATVDEVKKALPQITISESPIKKVKDLGMHFAVHDALGKNLVIECINGEIKVYDNPIGVMTNRPEFDWHINNLRNYINLDSRDKKPKTINGQKIEPTGVGSGMLGLPGDWTPPSRFVRTALCLNAALQPKNSAEAVNLAEHILNIVDIPKGVVKEPTAFPFVDLYGNAQWVIIKDLTNKVLYYKTYDNTAWKTIDLKKFNLDPGNPIKSVSIGEKDPACLDMSGKLK
ncbi:hypothetical protein A2276_08355 [candidate division WOR-1 bacterium RIFOXYA12_FULL_43_27]|uniref:Choloylglycine hydrolase/NAAA C-terminal domain-containing protein n=1 Tax=candidate division WOR-1 bacterium RIFOXYC2_FULL_46_14 TaxID=1802587 RepID=A0A1F4U669_UNCSA|nr:MAG: hypothetical protein A2276_08355 [candidate division WOR-1 bacterium RIFOXYA12_FULL_43_27]OGC20605.1 MAG: hypothetical protein A2292_06180 [candidate division WOR-1 bacterium RIFOXYB2_FULL_46_45]OGC31658.1 MAG: hypothetical protein A2232_05270 [candidate division WOR-1 bacterium RIFOXYA2_FULL_46_56]OGC40446.1 MAG: hypothetical protein A2438_04210 [candidate division WOR-1 bacterium RIFOXYC2_FULL_46_14]